MLLVEGCGHLGWRRSVGHQEQTKEARRNRGLRRPLSSLLGGLNPPPLGNWRALIPFSTWTNMYPSKGKARATTSLKVARRRATGHGDQFSIGSLP